MQKGFGDVATFGGNYSAGLLPNGKNVMYD